MRCECCEREATIHEVLIHHGARRERHLCEACAGKAGLSANPHDAVTIALGASSLQLVNLTHPNKPDTPGTPATPETTGVSGVACASCGTTYAAFKECGLLGCPSCYDAFVDRLGPMIERAHEGGCHHVGKFPKRALRECRSLGDKDRLEILLGGVRQREQRLDSLRRSLEKAVRDEDYEQAATIRDELARVGGLGAATGESVDAPGPASPSDPEGRP